MPELNEVLNEDLAQNEKIQELGDVNKIAQSYLELQNKMGSIKEEHQKELANKVEIPGEDADEETKNSFFKALGRPETPDDYSEVEVDGIPEGFGKDEETMKAIKQASYEAGISDSQYKQVMETLTKQQLVSLDNFIKTNEQAEREAIEDLTELWGGEEGFKKKLTMAQRLIEKYDSDKSDLKEFLNDSRLGSYVPLVKLLGEVASEVLTEEETITGDPSKSKDKDKEIELSPTTGRPMLKYDKSPELMNS